MVEVANGSYRDLRAWRLEELTKHLGPDIATRLNSDVEFGLLAGTDRRSR